MNFVALPARELALGAVARKLLALGASPPTMWGSVDSVTKKTAFASYLSWMPGKNKI